MEWLDLVHPETGGRQRIPDDDQVLAVQRSKGWQVEDPDEDAARAPFVPRPAAADDADQWVVLVHPDLPPPATNTVPNRPEALEGAYRAGWRLPDADPDAVRDELREMRGGSAAHATAAERAEAEQRAALAAATTDDPAGTAGETEDAGDGDDERE